MLLEARNVGGAVVPVQGDEIDRASGAGFQEGFQVRNTHWGGTVGDSGGAELGLSSEGLHEGLVTRCGCTRVEVRLRGKIRLVESKEVLAPLRDGGGSSLLPAVGVIRTGSPEHGHVFERRRDGRRGGTPVVRPGDLGVGAGEAGREIGVVVGETALAGAAVAGGSDDNGGWRVDWGNGGWDEGRHDGGDGAYDAADDAIGVLSGGGCSVGNVGCGAGGSFGGNLGSSASSGFGGGLRSSTSSGFGGSLGSSTSSSVGGSRGGGLDSGIVSYWGWGSWSSCSDWRSGSDRGWGLGSIEVGRIGSSLGLDCIGGGGRGGDVAGAIPPDSHPVGDGVDLGDRSLFKDSITPCDGVEVSVSTVRNGEDTAAGQQRGSEGDCREREEHGDLTEGCSSLLLLFISEDAIFAGRRFFAGVCVKDNCLDASWEVECRSILFCDFCVLEVLLIPSR